MQSRDQDDGSHSMRIRSAADLRAISRYALSHNGLVSIAWSDRNVDNSM
jgi:hypothetical protein